MFEHKHPLNLIDMWSAHPQDEEEYDEEGEEKEDSVSKQDIRYLCHLCSKDITWYHRYYYSCGQCDYAVHKFCAKLPETLEHVSDVIHTLNLQIKSEWTCNNCRTRHEPNTLCYHCSQCDYNIDVDCAMKRLQQNIIYHPSHIHPLVCIAKQILCYCDACGKEHKGTFYQCSTCCSSFIHSDCVFLPKKLQIQHATKDFFSHTHPLTLAYSFPKADQKAKFSPRCRVCRTSFPNENLWIYKCEKCRYYAHLDCATSRTEPFMSIFMTPGMGKTFKNYDDAEHPDLLHLPFPDQTCTILKHLFFKENGSEVCEVNKTHFSHQHPLMLQDIRCTDISEPTSSRTKLIPYHNPMKKIELLCNGCIRPIMDSPFYKCANEDNHCNFVLHEWCTRLPSELKDHPDHPQHTLLLLPKIPHKFSRLFVCAICNLRCNGFTYYCDECRYCIDVNCAFLPQKITHKAHPNHLLSRFYQRARTYYCRICSYSFRSSPFSFGCHICDFHVHPECALLITQTTTHRYDKHPMNLSYFPIENHKSEYFCEVCEEEFDPEYSFYHCRVCAQSIHPACAPLKRPEDKDSYHGNAIYWHVNMKSPDLKPVKSTYTLFHPFKGLQVMIDAPSVIGDLSTT